MKRASRFWNKLNPSGGVSWCTEQVLASRGLAGQVRQVLGNAGYDRDRFIARYTFVDDTHRTVDSLIKAMDGTMLVRGKVVDDAGGVSSAEVAVQGAGTSGQASTSTDGGFKISLSLAGGQDRKIAQVWVKAGNYKEYRKDHALDGACPDIGIIALEKESEETEEETDGIDLTALRSAVNAAVETCRSAQAEIDRGKQSAQSAANAGNQMGSSLTEFDNKVRRIQPAIDACKRAPNIRSQAARDFGKASSWANHAIQGYSGALSQAKYCVNRSAINKARQLVEAADKLKYQAARKYAFASNLLKELSRTEKQARKARSEISQIANLLNQIDIHRATISNYINAAERAGASAEQRVMQCRSQRGAAFALAATLSGIDAPGVGEITAPLGAISDFSGAVNVPAMLQSIYEDARELSRIAKTMGGRAPKASDMAACNSIDSPLSEQLAAMQAILGLDKLGNVGIEVAALRQECKDRNADRRAAEEERRRIAEEAARRARAAADEAARRAAEQRAAQSGNGGDNDGRGDYDWDDDGGNLDPGPTDGTPIALPTGSSGDARDDVPEQNVATAGGSVGGGYGDDPVQREREISQRAEEAERIAAAANPGTEDEPQRPNEDPVDEIDLDDIPDKGASSQPTAPDDCKSPCHPRPDGKGCHCPEGSSREQPTENTPTTEVWYVNCSSDGEPFISKSVQQSAATSLGPYDSREKAKAATGDLDCSKKDSHPATPPANPPVTQPATPPVVEEETERSEPEAAKCPTYTKKKDGCIDGFVWSRRIVACMQETCPGDIGRTYTLYCKCDPKKPVYDPCRPGYVLRCE